MRPSIGTFVRCVFVNALLLAAAATAWAGAHTWDVNEVFSNASGTIQFVELREANGTPNETGLPATTSRSNAETFMIPGPALTPPTSNKFFLIATADFAALPGAPTPDRILPAGNVPFFATGGDTVTYGRYDSLVFGPVPTNGIDSLRRNLTTGPNTPTNYAGATGQVDASSGPPVPALNGLGIGLVIGLLLLAGVVVVRRSRSAAA